MSELPPGSGAVCSPLMAVLIAKAGNGVLSTARGGEELRKLYREGQQLSHSSRFPTDRPLDPFASSLCSVAPCRSQRLCHEVRHRRPQWCQKRQSTSPLFGIKTLTDLD
jgi:hypothetical protein